MRRLRWAVLVVVLVATGCAGAPGPGPTPTTARPTFDHTSIPTADPTGARFTFDQAATFDDGVAIQVNEISAGTAGDGVTGAEGTDGSIVTAQIMITNGGDVVLPGEQVQVWGFYDNVGAPKVVDPSGALGDSFRGDIPPGDRVVATMGWAMPADRLGAVSIMVRDNVPGHGPVRFTGPVA